MLRLETVGAHVPIAHGLQLVGEEGEHPLPVGLGSEAAVAVAMAELLQLIVQVPHSPSWLFSIEVFVSRCVSSVVGVIASVSVSVRPAGRGQARDSRDTGHHSRVSAGARVSSSCRRCTSALATDARLEERDRIASRTIDPRSKERLLGRGALPSEWTTWRRCASLLGDVRGPRGPVTSLPTLNRAREGLKRQGLRRVVTGRPVTTLAGDADVRGVVRRAVSSAGSRAHHTSRAIAQRFTHGDDDRCRARWPCQSSLATTARSESSRDFPIADGRPRVFER